MEAPQPAFSQLGAVVQISNDDLKQTPIFAAMLTENPRTRTFLADYKPVTALTFGQHSPTIEAEQGEDDAIILVKPLPQRKPQAHMPSWVRVRTS